MISDTNNKDPRKTVKLKEAPPRSYAGDLFAVYMGGTILLVFFYVYGGAFGYRFTVPMGKIVLCALGYGGFLYVWVMWEPLGIGWKILDGGACLVRWVSRPVKCVLRGCFAVPRWIEKIRKWSHER